MTVDTAKQAATATAAAVEHILQRRGSDASLRTTAASQGASPASATPGGLAVATGDAVAGLITAQMQAMYLSPASTAPAQPLSPSTASFNPIAGTLPPGARAWHRFDHSQIKVLLLEGVHSAAQDALTACGFQVEAVKGALSEEELCARIADVHVVGIRSKTKVTRKVLSHARRLLAIGCFCIGTNQVDMEEASARGVCVFNSPYANSRSVAEMTLANIINLHRQLGDRNSEMHRGAWLKVSQGCYEVRGKTLGIIGYGHIGSSLSVLAEALGMQVVYHDAVQLMPLGSARQLSSLDAVLESADVVTLHVPETPDTKGMIGAKEIAKIKKGAYLINASRGSVVDIDALAAALREDKIAGAAVDVFPVEPAKNGEKVFESPLQGLANVLLSPHIGGSTEEAQRAIGVEVSRAIIAYVSAGVSSGSVNLPGLALKPLVANPLTIRIVNIHKNVPGVLRKINLLLAQFNIERQSSESQGAVAYMAVDVTLDEGRLQEELQAVHEGLQRVEELIMLRIFY